MPIAFNPATGLIYASTWNVPRIRSLQPPKPTVLGANTTRHHQPPRRDQNRATCSVISWRSIRSPASKWEVPLTDFPSSAGMLVTGGGLVFTGKLSGEVVALDEATGKTLWQFKTEVEHQRDGDYLHAQRQAVP